jgi:hypothetical protein
MIKALLVLFIPFCLTGWLQAKSLTIIISSGNHYYYYEDKLEKDASNFKQGSYDTILDWTRYLEKKAANKKLVVRVKIENKDSLNDQSKKLISSFEQKKANKNSVPNKNELALIHLIEKLSS